MSAPADVETVSSASKRPSGPPRGRTVRPPRILAAAIAGSWLVPLAAHALGADIVLPVVIVLATAAQLTIGTTVLDRLIPAVGLVSGAARCGLNPVPVAGRLGARPGRLGGRRVGRDRGAALGRDSGVPDTTPGEANPAGPGCDSMPALLRRLADSIEALGPVEVSSSGRR